VWLTFLHPPILMTRPGIISPAVHPMFEGSTIPLASGGHLDCVGERPPALDNIHSTIYKDQGISYSFG
jgi:hypothetical protein